MGEIVELPDLRDRTRVFRDRDHAGSVLAGLLADLRGGTALLLAVPAGGVPVARRLAEELALPLDVAVVSKITPTWNTEVGYGAVAFDGTVRLNEPVLRHFRLSPEEVERDTNRTRDKVTRRGDVFRGGAPFPSVGGRPVILVDDGLASGFTMVVAVEALRGRGAGDLRVAVPTGHLRSVEWLGAKVERVYCANVRSGRSFAVADAYREWSDVDEEAAVRMLKAASPPPGR